MAYFFFERSNGSVKEVVLHIGSCAWCNNGRGVTGEADSTKWSDGYPTAAVAHQKAVDTRHTVRDCGHCKPKFPVPGQKRMDFSSVVKK